MDGRRMRGCSSCVEAATKTADKWETLPNGWTDESRKKFWDSLTGNVKHKVTKCMKEMKGKIGDPGAFCASLADRVDPGWRSRESSEIDMALRVAARFLNDT